MGPLNSTVGAADLLCSGRSNNAFDLMAQFVTKKSCNFYFFASSFMTRFLGKCTTQFGFIPRNCKRGLFCGFKNFDHAHIPKKNPKPLMKLKSDPPSGSPSQCNQMKDLLTCTSSCISQAQRLSLSEDGSHLEGVFPPHLSPLMHIQQSKAGVFYFSYRLTRQGANRFCVSTGLGPD